jgi:protoheme IX farnesyltransferase
VARQIVLYSWAMVACSLALVPVAGTGWVYGVSATVLGALFLYEAHRLHHRVRIGVQSQPMRLFHWSITYLTLLFVAVALDPFLG